MGAKLPVHVETLVMRGTVEEAVLKRTAAAAAGTALGPGAGPLSSPAAAGTAGAPQHTHAAAAGPPLDLAPPQQEQAGPVRCRQGRQVRQGQLGAEGRRVAERNALLLALRPVPITELAEYEDLPEGEPEEEVEARQAAAAAAAVVLAQQQPQQQQPQQEQREQEQREQGQVLYGGPAAPAGASASNGGEQKDEGVGQDGGAGRGELQLEGQRQQQQSPSAAARGAPNSARQLTQRSVAAAAQQQAATLAAAPALQRPSGPPSAGGSAAADAPLVGICQAGKQHRLAGGRDDTADEGLALSAAAGSAGDAPAGPTPALLAVKAEQHDVAPWPAAAAAATAAQGRTAPHASEATSTAAAAAAAGVEVEASSSQATGEAGAHPAKRRRMVCFADLPPPAHGSRGAAAATGAAAGASKAREEKEASAAPTPAQRSGRLRARLQQALHRAEAAAAPPAATVCGVQGQQEHLSESQQQAECAALQPSLLQAHQLPPQSQQPMLQPPRQRAAPSASAAQQGPPLAEAATPVAAAPAGPGIDVCVLLLEHGQREEAQAAGLDGALVGTFTGGGWLYGMSGWLRR